MDGITKPIRIFQHIPKAFRNKKHLALSLLIIASLILVLYIVNNRSSETDIQITDTHASNLEYDTVLLTKLQRQHLLDEINNPSEHPTKASGLEDLKSPQTSRWTWDAALISNSLYVYLTGDREALNTVVNILDDKVFGPDPYKYEPRVRPWGGSEHPYTSGPSCNSLALSYDLIKPYLSPSQEHTYRRLLVGWGTGSYNWFSARADEGDVQNADNYLIGGLNINGSMAACLGNIALVLPDYPQSDKWLDTATRAVRGHFEYAYNPGGDYIEGHGYQGYSSPQDILFAYALKNKTGEDLFNDSGARNMLDFFTYAYMSGNHFPVYGDNTHSTDLYGEYLYFLNDEFKHNDGNAGYHKWLWDHVRGYAGADNRPRHFSSFDKIAYLMWYPVGLHPTDPDEDGLQTGQYFPSSSTPEQDFSKSGLAGEERKGGMYVLRTKWNTEEAQTVWVQNRWRAQVHQHYDPNTFTYSAYGADVLSDNEDRISYHDPKRGRLANKNAVIFDKVFDFGATSSTAPASLGLTRNFLSTEVADIIDSDASYPYRSFFRQSNIWPLKNGFLLQPSINEVKPEIRANKIMILPKSLLPGTVMLDEHAIDDNGLHLFRMLLRYPSQRSRALPWKHHSKGIAYKVKNNKGAYIDMSLFFLQPTAINIETRDNYDGEDHKDKVIVVTQSHLTHGVEFLTVMAPGLLYNGETLEIEHDSSSQDPPYIYRYTYHKRSDSTTYGYIVYNPDRDIVNVGSVKTDAKLAIFDKQANYRDRTYILVEATTLEVQDDGNYGEYIPLLSSPEPITLTWERSEDHNRNHFPKVVASSPKNVTAKIYHRKIGANAMDEERDLYVTFNPRYRFTSNILPPSVDDPL